MDAMIKKLSEMDSDELAQIYKSVFGSPEGKLILQDLKNRCYFYTPTYQHQNPDAAEGMRNVVMNIESQINYESPVEESGEQYA
jgi:uncharacterized protein with von Willebrand factor type A (vWA) domain